MKKIQLIALLFVLTLVSCRKDIDDETVIIDTPDPTLIDDYEPEVENIMASLVGYVVDEMNEPVTDVDVKLGSLTTTTDTYGHFFFNSVTLNAKGTFVTVEKEGYFLGSRRFFPVADAKNRVKIQLLTQNFNQNFSAQDGGTISLPDGASVQFASNSIADASGTAYTGTVNVASKWLDPSALETFEQMPGNLQGVNTLNEQMVLGTYGMIAVELQGDAGQALNIAEGSTATLTMPVPTSMQSGAPSEIPLWSFNTTYGMWVEESSATLQNGVYVGEVSHFSFWNCDIPMDYVDLSLTLNDENGNALSNYMVTISLEDVGCGTGFTDQNGGVNGFVPGNAELLLEVYDVCGNVIYSSNIGPFASDTDLGIVTVTSSNVSSTTITGNLLDCDGNDVTEGLVIASYDGLNTYHYLDNSNFEVHLTTCTSPTTIDVIGVNIAEFIQSEAQTVNSDTQTDLGDIDVCDEQLTNFITLTVDGTTRTYFNPTVNVYSDSLGGGSTYIEAASDDQSYYVGFQINGIDAGDYSGSDGNVIEVIFNQGTGWQFGGSFTNMTVTEFGSTITGTFSGLTDNNGQTIDLTGEFSVDQ